MGGFGIVGNIGAGDDKLIVYVYLRNVYMCQATRYPPPFYAHAATTVQNAERLCMSSWSDSCQLISRLSSALCERDLASGKCYGSNNTNIITGRASVAGWYFITLFLRVDYLMPLNNEFPSDADS